MMGRENGAGPKAANGAGPEPSGAQAEEIGELKSEIEAMRKQLSELAQQRKAD
mgnify:FL=1